MITVISMGQEICLILGQVSHTLLYWKKNLQTDICGPGRDFGKTVQTSRPDHLRNLESTPSWRRSKSGPMKSSIWITHDNCEGSVSLTLRIRNSRKPSRLLVRSWKHQWLLLCLAKLWRRIVWVVHPTKLKQNLRAFWKLMNPKDCVWGILTKSYCRKRKQFMTALQFGSQIYSFASSQKNSSSKSSSGQGMGKIGKDSGVGPDKSQK